MIITVFLHNSWVLYRFGRILPGFFKITFPRICKVLHQLGTILWQPLFKCTFTHFLSFKVTKNKFLHPCIFFYSFFVHFLSLRVVRGMYKHTTHIFKNFAHFLPIRCTFHTTFLKQLMLLLKIFGVKFTIIFYNACSYYHIILMHKNYQTVWAQKITQEKLTTFTKILNFIKSSCIIFCLKPFWYFQYIYIYIYIYIWATPTFHAQFSVPKCLNISITLLTRWISTFWSTGIDNFHL